MCPRFSFNNNQDRLGRHAKNVAYFPQSAIMASIDGADRQYMVGGQFGIIVSLALWLSSLRHRVLCVSSRIPFKKMGRVTAGGPVACMANQKSGPVVVLNQERETVGRALAPRLIHVHCAVPAAYRSASPLPAFTVWAVTQRFIDAFPKTPDVLIGELWGVYSNSSHCENLRDRFELWLGSFGVSRTVRADCILAHGGGRYGD